MSKFKNIVGEKMLGMLGLAKSFIASGILRIKGDIPLEKIIDENVSIGGNLHKLFKDFGKAAVEGNSCSIEFDLSDPLLQNLAKDYTISIKELPAFEASITVGHNINLSDNSGKLLLNFQLRFTSEDKQNEPVTDLTMSFSMANFKHLFPLLKSQFLSGRITALVNKYAFEAFVKSANLVKPATRFPRGQEQYAYEAQIKLLTDLFIQKSPEEVAALAETYVKEIFASTKEKLPSFDLTVGISVTDKLTLSVEFYKADIKKAE